MWYTSPLSSVRPRRLRVPPSCELPSRSPQHLGTSTAGAAWCSNGDPRGSLGPTTPDCSAYAVGTARQAAAGPAPLDVRTSKRGGENQLVEVISVGHADYECRCFPRYVASGIGNVIVFARPYGLATGRPALESAEPGFASTDRFACETRRT